MEEQLINAAKKGNIDQFRKILKANGENINCTDIQISSLFLVF